MPRMTAAEYAAYEARHRPKQPTPAAGVDRESDLHQQILDYCAAQWPKWKVIHARMDCASTIARGAQDLTIFMPGGRVICGECKTRTGKLSLEQSAWAMEMLRLGHVVHVWRSMEDFLTAVKG